MKKGWIFYCLFFCSFAWSLSSGSCVFAQESDGMLLEGGQTTVQYILEMSGTVQNEKFTNARSMLTLGMAPPDSVNSYFIKIIGFPAEQQRNVFYWDSEEAAMNVVSNSITCTLQNTALRPANIYFYYLSPFLYKRKPLYSTHNEKEDMQRVMKTAVPTKIYAKGGSLQLTVNPHSISGSVTLYGYDGVEKANITYAASFFGKRALRVEQTEQGTSR